MYGKVLSAYVTNLGKYTEGQLVGRWVDFPTTSQEIQNVLREIGIDGIRYEEIFITDYHSNIYGLTDCLDEYENLSVLNYIACKIQESGYDTEQLESLLEFGAYGGNVTELLTLLNNLDCYVMYGDIKDDYDLGYYLIHKTGLYTELQEKMGSLANYIDYEAYGRDVRIEESGLHTVNDYYVCMTDNPTVSNINDVPEEYRISV